ncbi:MAG: DMT family transporter [Steroidobacteraceae bacterium]|nr:DMT family transporter [Steroidobacteraceae bacterium]
MRTAGRARPLAVLAIAVLGMSHGAIFARLAEAEALAIAAWRLALATLVVLPLALAFGRLRAHSRRAELAAVLAGMLLALHFAAWIASLDHTTVAQSVVLVTTAPIWVAVLGRLLGLVRLAPAGWFAIGLCLAGSAVIAGPDLLTGGSWRGNALALAGAVAVAAYLLAAREAQREIDFLGFVARAYGIGALALVAAVLATGTPASGFAAPTWLALIALALVSQLVGHGGANWALRHLSPAFVSVALIGEPVLAAVAAWWLFAEPVTASTAAGGVLILAGLLLAGRALLADERTREDAARRGAS